MRNRHPAAVRLDQDALCRLNRFRRGTRQPLARIVNAIVLGDSHAKFLDRAAANTGGSVASATKESIARTLQGVLADINSRYLLVYQSQGTKRGWRTIAISSRHEIAGARKGYFAE